MTSASPINPKNATSSTNFSVARVSLMVLRWIATVPMVVYTLGGVIFGSIGLVSQGLAGVFNTPAGALWASSFGRNSFDLFAVFFERKLTLGIAGYPVGGDQLWWWWLRPAFEQAPIFWLGFAVIWAAAWVLMGYILRLLRPA